MEFKPEESNSKKSQTEINRKIEEISKKHTSSKKVRSKLTHRKTLTLTKDQFDNWDAKKIRGLIDKYILGVN